MVPGALVVLAAGIFFTGSMERGSYEAATPRKPSSGIEVPRASASKAELLKGGRFFLPSYFEPLPAREAGAQSPNGDAPTSHGFVYRRNGYTLYLTPSEALFTLEVKDSSIGSELSSSSRGSFGIRLVGAAPSPTIEGLERMAGYKSYFIGNDPSRWRTAVPHFARVRYGQVYPGIEVKDSSIGSELSSSSRGSFGIRLVGAAPSPTIEGLERMAGYKSYFIGNDPSRWRTAVPHFARVRYGQVYPGIDVVYYGVEEGPEYDLVVSPGADPGRIVLEFVGVEGLTLHPSGDLSFEVGETRVRKRRPRIYQELGAQRAHVEGSYRLLGNDRVGFVVGAYDPTRTLVIDPVLIVSTYLGGDYIDSGLDVALDAGGNIYVTGMSPG